MWIARDKKIKQHHEKTVYLFKEKPIRGGTKKDYWVGQCFALLDIEYPKFSHVTWADEPVEVKIVLVNATEPGEPINLKPGEFIDDPIKDCSSCEIKTKGQDPGHMNCIRCIESIIATAYPGWVAVEGESQPLKIEAPCKRCIYLKKGLKCGTKEGGNRLSNHWTCFEPKKCCNCENFILATKECNGNCGYLMVSPDRHAIDCQWKPIESVCRVCNGHNVTCSVCSEYHPFEERYHYWDDTPCPKCNPGKEAIPCDKCQYDGDICPFKGVCGLWKKFIEK